MHVGLEAQMLGQEVVRHIDKNCINQLIKLTLWLTINSNWLMILMIWSFVGQLSSKEVVEWRTATGNAATVATATFYVVKDNKAEKIP
jgi:hypothetical protein